jgi:hypothetical protein
VMRFKDEISYNSYTYPSSLTTSKTEVIIVNFRIRYIWGGILDFLQKPLSHWPTAFHLEIQELADIVQSSVNSR